MADAGGSSPAKNEGKAPAMTQLEIYMLGELILRSRRRASMSKEPYWIRDKKTGCWNWIRNTTGIRPKKNTYGMMWDAEKRRMVTVHSLIFRLYKRERNIKGVVHHVCENTLCVNPRHLKALTQRQNILLGTSPSARCAKVTHCPKGHAYAGENLIERPSGRRGCRACQRAAKRKWTENHRKAA